MCCASVTIKKKRITFAEHKNKIFQKWGVCIEAFFRKEKKNLDIDRLEAILTCKYVDDN